MLQIYFITSNDGKIRSMRKWLEPSGIRVYKYRRKIETPERKLPTVEETATYKALDIRTEVHAPFVVQDSGFFMNAIPGFPGPDVNRVLSTMGIEGLIKLLVRGKDRTCYFKDVIAFWSPICEADKVKNDIPYGIVLFASEVHGKIAEQPSSVSHPGAWSPLWNIFIPDGFESTLASMTVEERKSFDAQRTLPETNCFVAFAEWINKNQQYLFIQQKLPFSD